MNVFRDRQQFRKTLFFNHHFDCTKFFQEIFSPLSSDGWRCVSAIISSLKNVQIMLESGNTFNCIICTLNIIYNKKNIYYTHVAKVILLLIIYGNFLYFMAEILTSYFIFRFISLSCVWI